MPFTFSQDPSEKGERDKLYDVSWGNYSGKVWARETPNGTAVPRLLRVEPLMGAQLNTRGSKKAQESGWTVPRPAKQRRRPGNKSIPLVSFPSVFWSELWLTGVVEVQSRMELQQVKNRHWAPQLVMCNPDRWMTWVYHFCFILLLQTFSWSY